MEDVKPTKPSYFFWKNEQLFIDLLVQTCASHDEVTGVHEDRLKVRLASTPVAGKANEHLIRMMAGYFGVPCNRVHLTKGHQSRMKQICVTNPLSNLPSNEE